MEQQMTNGEDALSYLQAAAAKAIKESNANGKLEAARMAYVFEGIIAEAVGKLSKEATMRAQDEEYDETSGCPNCSCAG